MFASCSVFLVICSDLSGGGGGGLVSCLGRLLCRDEEEDRLRLLSRSPLCFLLALRCFLWRAFGGGISTICALFGGGGVLGGGDEIANGDILTGWGCLFRRLWFGKWGSRVRWMWNGA